MVSILTAAVAFGGEGRIEVQAGQFRATRYLSQAQQVAIKPRNLLTGPGEAEYGFRVPRNGWYELWVESCTWSTDLVLDGRLLTHTTFTSGEWKPDHRAEKVLNLFLAMGEHRLRFVRPWPPGLPYLHRFFLEPARDATGMVRLAPIQDCMVFRRGERFTLQLQAGRQAAAYDIHLTLADPETDRTARQWTVPVPAGEGLLSTTIDVATDRAGVFDLHVRDAAGRPMDRTVQFVVIDTRPAPAADLPAKLNKRLVQEIDCARQEPDYSTSPTRVIRAALGAYRESGTRGRFGQQLQADSFAYTLKLPSIQEPYLAEIDYPDDDQRTFSIALIERAANPYAPTQGVASGGVFSLSGQMQPHVLFFYPREEQPRLLFQNWYPGQRAAAARIHVYRITGDVPCLRPQAGGRAIGMWQEEPMRVTGNYGAAPTGNAWPNVLRPVERMAQLSGYVGFNLYEPTIAVYQTRLWPSRQLPTFAVDPSILGPGSLKDPLEKDLLRLVLLTAERHRMSVVGQLFITPQTGLSQYLEQRFGGDGDAEHLAAGNKPWLLVHRSGKPPHGWFNPLYPPVEDWVADVVQELADRYKDSPAFKGLAIRILAWQFYSWQALPSIHYGYEDYTIEQFQRETGVKVPVARDAADRFQQRYRWLMANAYQRWVDWRCDKIFRYHCRLARILTAARPDLKLYLDCFGPNFAEDYSNSDWEERGWLGLIRETGLDPARYRGEPSIVLSDARSYPPAIRAVREGPLGAARQRAEFFDPQPVREAAKPQDAGSVSAVRMDAQSMEGEMIEYARLGMPRGLLQNKKTIHGAGILNGAGRHALLRYANAMADGNITWITDGSHGQPLGQPQFTREFFAEYRALPEIGMARLEGSGDPVAVWYGGSGARYFYLVNRTGWPIDVELHFSAPPQLTRLATGERMATEPASSARWKLKSYELLAFENAVPQSRPLRIAATPPPEVTEKLRRQVQFVETGLAEAGGGTQWTLTRFSAVDASKARSRLAEIRAELAAGHVWAARIDLLHPCLQRIYEGLGAEPPGLFHRWSPQPAEAVEAAVAKAPAAGGPRLELVKIIGDMRGAGLHNLSVAVSEQGEACLLMAEGRVATFGADGSYRNCIEAKLASPTADKYLAVSGRRLLVGDYRQDYPWVYCAQRQGTAPGRFQNPAMATQDAEGRVYVADRGNGRIQVFRADPQDQPERIIQTAGGPLAVDVRGPWMALLTDRNTLVVFRRTDESGRPVATLNIGVGGHSVAVGPEATFYVAQNGGPDHYDLRKYQLQASVLAEVAVLARSFMAQWPNLFPADVPLATDPQGQVWFATDTAGRLLSLDPRTDTIRQRGRLPGRALALGFAPDGTCHVVGYGDREGKVRVATYQVEAQGLKPLGSIPAQGVLSGDNAVPIWGVLPDRDGGVYVRVVEEGWRKGWPALTIKKVYADGRMDPFLDFGELYAVRRTFGPWACVYSLQFDAQHNIILTALPLQAVYQVAADGKIRWEAGAQPQGGADAMTLVAPQQTAIDSQGRIWVVDSETDKISCLSPQGKLLLEYGGPATWDDRQGTGFAHPTGVATVRADGVDYLYVGDAGNQRIVKYRIHSSTSLTPQINGGSALPGTNSNCRSLPARTPAKRRTMP
jgi:sugar lactone lactonase YvrE